MCMYMYILTHRGEEMCKWVTSFRPITCEGLHFWTGATWCSLLHVPNVLPLWDLTDFTKSPSDPQGAFTTACSRVNSVSLLETGCKPESLGRWELCWVPATLRPAGLGVPQEPRGQLRTTPCVVNKVKCHPISEAGVQRRVNLQKPWVEAKVDTRRD